MADKPGPPRGDSPWVAFAKYTGICFEVAITIILSIYIGARLDAKFDKSPLLLVICLILGFAAAISIILKYSRMAGQDLKDSEKNGTRE